MTVLLKPKQGGRPIVVDKPIILIGRHPDCDVILENSQKISRKHCCVAQVDDRCVVRDLDSMNGVWVNGHRVDHSSDLAPGDELMIGDVPFEVHRHGAKIIPQKEPSKAAPARREIEGLSDDVPPVPRQKVTDRRMLDDASAHDVVEFSQAFALPSSENESGENDKIRLAEADESV